MYNPGDLTRHRSALTCNDCFGVLTVKFGIHKFLLGLPPSWLHNVNEFAENQEKAAHPYSNMVKKTFLIPIHLKLTMNLLSLIAWQARDLSVQ
jgi:hypothetical protein